MYPLSVEAIARVIVVVIIVIFPVFIICRIGPGEPFGGIIVTTVSLFYRYRLICQYHHSYCRYHVQLVPTYHHCCRLSSLLPVSSSVAGVIIIVAVIIVAVVFRVRHCLFGIVARRQLPSLKVPLAADLILRCVLFSVTVMALQDRDRPKILFQVSSTHRSQS
jgi:hypothetical protein